MGIASCSLPVVVADYFRCLCSCLVPSLLSPLYSRGVMLSIVITNKGGESVRYPCALNTKMFYGKEKEINRFTNHRSHSYQPSHRRD